MTFKALTLAGITLTLFAIPAAGHHSFAMFDASKTQTLSGTVKEFEWIQPHVWLHMTVADAAGKPQEWSFEAGGPGQLTVSGWQRDTLKPGDKISAAFHPLRDGSYGGQLLDVTLPNGKKLCQGAACRAASGTTGPGRVLPPPE